MSSMRPKLQRLWIQIEAWDNGAVAVGPGTMARLTGGTPLGRGGPSRPQSSADLIDRLTALINVMELFCTLQVERDISTLDLHIQEEQTYTTSGSETTVTLTLPPQTSQQ